MDRAIQALIEQREKSLQSIAALEAALDIDRKCVASLEERLSEAIALIHEIDEAIKALSPASVGARDAA